MWMDQECKLDATIYCHYKQISINISCTFSILSYYRYLYSYAIFSPNYYITCLLQNISLCVLYPESYIPSCITYVTN